VEALGKNRVIGVLMPQGEQHDIDMAYMLVNHLEIRHFEINVKDAIDAVLNNFPDEIKVTPQTKQNIPPRVRMTTLYAVAQSCNGIVINTCNLSESYIGYETLYGDLAGSMSPIKNLTATEIISLGDELELPHEWVHKTPDDGLPNSSPDEIKFGFTYKALDSWIRKNEVPDEFEVILKIVEKHDKSQFKRDIINIPAYEPGLKVY
jgi:NAD+ synthase